MHAAGSLADLRGLLDRVDAPALGDDGRLDALLASDPSDPYRRPLDHDRIRAGDPLGLDAHLAELPGVNRAGDVAILTSRRGSARSGLAWGPGEEGTSACTCCRRC